jgi:peptide/nickel transport system permease protein
MAIGGAILTAAALSFLGLGVQPPAPEWGVILNQGREYMRQAPWITIFPGLFISITVLAVNLFGDGLRSALDPRMKID